MVFHPTSSAFILAPLLGYLSTAGAAPSASDPCAAIGGKSFVPPASALACLKSFPFNETLRQNVLHNVARVFDFFTFEDFYLNSPPPFQESTANIRAEIRRINGTRYAVSWWPRFFRRYVMLRRFIWQTDFDFNLDLYNFITQLNDGHTRKSHKKLSWLRTANSKNPAGWFPSCYVSAFQNILPAPVIPLADPTTDAQSLFIIPDSVDLLTLLGPSFTSFFDSINFNWQRLAGARILEIEGMQPFDYVDLVARTVSGNYLDHGVRVNSVFSSYRIVGTDFSQRVGDLAGPTVPIQTSLTMKLVVVNSTKVETVRIPFLATFLGSAFTDKES